MNAYAGFRANRGLYTYAPELSRCLTPLRLARYIIAITRSSTRCGQISTVSPYPTSTYRESRTSPARGAPMQPECMAMQGTGQLSRRSVGGSIGVIHPPPPAPPPGLENLQPRRPSFSVSTPSAQHSPVSAVTPKVVRGGAFRVRTGASSWAAIGVDALPPRFGAKLRAGPCSKP